jgi:uncharacterized linocin/CFP29 family protein
VKIADLDITQSTSLRKLAFAEDRAIFEGY